mgnify:CR=1 FL=1
MDESRQHNGRGTVGDNIIRFPGTDEVATGEPGSGHVPLVRLDEGIEGFSVGGMVNVLAALAHRAQRRHGRLRLSTNAPLAVQGIRELVVERDPQSLDFMLTARYFADEE